MATSSFNLAVASFLLYVIHSTGNKRTYHWLNLSLVFLFLSLDESAQIHETFGGLVGKAVNSLLEKVPAFLSWDWTGAYMVLILLTGLYFWKFTFRLPGKTRTLFYVSGSIYVFAALVLELFEAHYDTVYGPDNLVNMFLFPLEEVFEMVGVIVFIYALLDYLMLKKEVLQFSVSNEG